MNMHCGVNFLPKTFSTYGCALVAHYDIFCIMGSPKIYIGGDTQPESLLAAEIVRTKLQLALPGAELNSRIDRRV